MSAPLSFPLLLQDRRKVWKSVGAIWSTTHFKREGFASFSAKNLRGGKLPPYPLAPLPPYHSGPTALFLQQMVPFASLVVWWSPSSLMLCCHYYAMKRENQDTTGPKTLWIRNLKSKIFHNLFILSLGHGSRIWEKYLIGVCGCFFIYLDISAY